MPTKLLQAVVITFALYLLMGMKPQESSTPQSASTSPSQIMPPHSVTPLHFAEVIDLIKGSL